MFAAYSQKDDSNSKQSEKKGEEINWLTNSSFVPNLVASSCTTSSKIQDTFKREQTGPEPAPCDDNTSETRYHSKTSKSKSSKSIKKKKKKKDEKSSDKKKDSSAVRQTALKKTEVLSKTTNRKTIFSNGLHLRPAEAFYEDLKGDRDNFAFPHMYFKNVARYVIYYHTITKDHHDKTSHLTILGITNQEVFWESQTGRNLM